MTVDLNLVLRIATIAFVICHLYLVTLWICAIVRTRLPFFWILACAGVIFLLCAVANLALAFDLPRIRELLGSQFVTSYEILIGIQPFNLLLGAIGYTMLVRYLIRSRTRRGRVVDADQSDSRFGRTEERLKKLLALRDKNLITEVEYQNRRTAILDDV